MNCDDNINESINNFLQWQDINSHGYKTYDCVFHYIVKHSSFHENTTYLQTVSRHTTAKVNKVGSRNNKHSRFCSIPVNVKRCIDVIEYMLYVIAICLGNYIKYYK